VVDRPCVRDEGFLRLSVVVFVIRLMEARESMCVETDMGKHKELIVNKSWRQRDQ
jgi:hypothetical protein